MSTTRSDMPGTDIERHEPRDRAAAAPREGADPAGFGLVEALIAFIVLAIGLLAVGGIALSVAAQTRNAAYTTDQDQAAQQVLEITATSDFSAVTVGTKDTTVTVGGTSYTVTRTVSQPNARTKKVAVDVPGRGDDPDETMVTYMNLPKSAPSSP